MQNINKFTKLIKLFGTNALLTPLRYKTAFALLLLFSLAGIQSFAQCCLTNSLIINTGYDPVANAAVTPWGQDPHWNVTSIDPGLVSDASAMGFTVVSTPGPADAEWPAGGWASYPGGTPGNWINCFNNNGYLQSAYANYGWTVSRTFNLQCSGQVTFNIPNITCDNWITGGFMIGTAIPTLSLNPLSCCGICCGTSYVLVVTRACYTAFLLLVCAWAPVRTL